MKRTLLFLLIANTALAQTDSTGVDTSKFKTYNAIKGELVVSATRAHENSPTTFQVVDKAELDKNNLGQDLPYLLDMTPSVVITSNSGNGIGYTDIHIRGVDNSRINATLNGIPINDGDDQSVYWVDIPDVVSSVQDIQIQRGVGTSTNGPGAFGGTLNLQTQNPAEKGFAEVDFSGGSFKTLKITGKAGTGVLKSGFFAEGSASYITSNGYIDRAFSNLHSYFAQAGWQGKNTLLRLIYFGGREKTYQSWDGVPQDSLKTHRTYNDLGTDGGLLNPPYPDQTDNYWQDYLQLLLSQRLPKNLNLNAGLFTTLGRGYYQEYVVGDNFSTYGISPIISNGDTTTTGDVIRQKWLRNIFYGGTFSLDYNHKDFTATFGGMLSGYRDENYGIPIWAEGNPAFNPNYHYYDGFTYKTDFNVYAKFNYLLKEKVNFYLDLQYRYVNYKTSGTDDALNPYYVKDVWNFFNPKVGVLYKINYLNQVYASFALGNREPNYYDLIDAQPGHLPGPETLRDLEVGYKLLHSKFPFYIDYYLMDYKNQLVLTGQLDDVGNTIETNVPSSYRTGIEVAGAFNFYRRDKGNKSVVPLKVFDIQYTFAYSLNKIQSFNEYIYTYDPNYNIIDSLTQVINHKNTDISFSPDIVASLALTAYPVKGLAISIMGKAISRQFLDNTSNTDRMLAPFNYTNVNISYTLPVHRPTITLKLLLNNIFNQWYSNNGATYPARYATTNPDGSISVSPVVPGNYYFPQAGFNVLAGVSVRY